MSAVTPTISATIFITSGLKGSSDPPRLIPSFRSQASWWTKRPAANGRAILRERLAAKPSEITEKVKESIKAAEATCAEDASSGECAAAWDEVEELSAAASHARDRFRATDADPLETFCKDNPETKECRTYED